MVTYRAYQRGDEYEIQHLYRLIFNREISLDEWRWLYEQTPLGPAVIAVAVNDRGQIVGHYGIQPRVACVAGQSTTVGLGIGAMMLPEHRDLATFINLVKFIYPLCQQRGIQVIYGFPNQNSWTIFEKFLRWDVRPAIAELVLLPPYAVPETHDDYVFNNILDLRPSAHCEDTKNIRILHNSDWLEWRFSRRPNTGYTVFGVGSGTEDANGEVSNGYIALKTYVSDGNEVWGHILDCQALNPHTLNALIAKSIHYFQQSNVAKISMWQPTDDMILSSLVKFKFIRSYNIRRYCYYVIDNSINSLIASIQQWSLTMSDSDVY